MVVMKAVVLHIPCLRLHPVAPISNATGNSAESESSRIVFAGIDAIVAAMAGVVRHHGPTRIGPGGQCRNRNWIGVKPHGSHTQRTSNVSPVEDLWMALLGCCDMILM